MCEVCGERPPRELFYGSRKWRWVTFHMLTAHAPEAKTTKEKERIAKTHPGAAA